LKSTKKRLL